MDWLVSVFSNPDVQRFLMEFAKASLLQSDLRVSEWTIKKGKLKKSIEWQLAHCLQTALKYTAVHLEWTKDEQDISKDFILKLSAAEFCTELENSCNKEIFYKIFQDVVGPEVTANDIAYFEDSFSRQLAKSEYTELRQYLNLKQLLKSEKKVAISDSPYILTPYVPRWNNVSLIDRTVFVDNLCKELQIGKPHICLTGMGGIGKTEILNQVFNFFAHKPNAHFDHIALLSYNGSMDNSLMQIDYPGDKNVETVWGYIRRLCAEKSVLLLIDDDRLRQTERKQPTVQDESFSKLFALNATVLFASRTLPENFTRKHVEAPSVDVCKKIFKTARYAGEHYRLSDDDDKILFDIIEKRAGRNPLIVMRLGTIANTHSWSITELDKKLSEQNFDIRKGFNNETLQAEINKLYRIDDIKNSSEKSLLEAFALFPNIPLNQEICIQWLHEDANVDKGLCSRLLNNLSNRTWLTSHESKQECVEVTCSYSMHPLVKAVVKTQTNITLNNHRNLIEHLSDSVSWNQQETYQKAQPYISYADSLAEYFSQNQVKATGLASLMLWLGRYYDNIADYTKALEWYEKALFIGEEILGEEHPDTATTYNNIAAVYSNQGEYDRALEWYTKALTIRERVLGIEHPSTAATYNNIAAVYSNQCEYNKALEWYKKALAIYETALGKTHPNTATTYNNIASVYYNQGKYKEALDYYNNAKKRYEIMNNDSNARYNSDALIVENSIAKTQFVLSGKMLVDVEKETGAGSEKEEDNEKVIAKLIAITEEKISQNIQKMKNSFRVFLSEEEIKNSEIPVFEVLRRWNSYTPIIADDFRISKGGGYFYKIGDCGIVIDPGFNFIDNFKSTGRKFKEIDHVLITHAHNDHTADVESILTLLHKYNENVVGDVDNPGEDTIVRSLLDDLRRFPSEEDKKHIKDKAKELFLKDKRRKRISFYMTASTYKKYASMFDLYSTNNYDIIIVKAGDPIQVEYPGIGKKKDYATGLKINAIYAKHDDLLSDRDSIGFLIEYGDFFLVYTGDTGFDGKVETCYKKLKKDMPTGKTVVLLAHFGGFKECETKFSETIAD
jgi:tetratricopeptide (TPR) repeat protein/ribonuclease BN (tRNA processing enzyme)